jgi:hypothetical protein
MIELTDQQAQQLESADSTPAHVTNPRTNETFVLVRVEEYKRLTEPEYDASPWTREEMEAMAWEVGKSIGWDEMDEYDQLPEKP